MRLCEPPRVDELVIATTADQLPLTQSSSLVLLFVVKTKFDRRREWLFRGAEWLFLRTQKSWIAAG
jgi:hypothetical protein